MSHERRYTITTYTNQQISDNAYLQHLVGTPELYQQLFAGLSTQDIEQVEKIFRRNYTSGRAQRIMGQALGYTYVTNIHQDTVDSVLSMPRFSQWERDYLLKVLITYRQESTRIQALANRDPIAWQTLSLHLMDSAYKLLIRRGINPTKASELAPDMAQQTCLRIYVSVFPCDISFDTWAHVILKNQILQTFTRSRDLLDHQPYESLNKLETEIQEDELWVPTSEQLKPIDNLALPNSIQIEDREWLISALAELPSNERRAVIVYTYFYGLSDEEIALMLGKSQGAVHTLRHRALKQLHAILGRTFEQPGNPLIKQDLNEIITPNKLQNS